MTRPSAPATPSAPGRHPAGVLVVLATVYVLIAFFVGSNAVWQRLAAPAPVSLTPAACLVALDDAGQPYTVANLGHGTGCDAQPGVSLAAVAEIDLTRPAAMACPLALSLNQFASTVVQPAALTHFDSPVATIAHLGGFACRGIRGDPKIPSEHAAGRAIDIAGFALADGRTVTVAGDWRADTPAGDFLAQVAKQARRHFSTVLTPEFDAAHAGHFHLGHRLPSSALAELAKALPGDLYTGDDRRRTQPLAPADTGFPRPRERPPRPLPGAGQL